jgi:hypothetical protein
MSTKEQLIWKKCPLYIGFMNYILCILCVSFKTKSLILRSIFRIHRFESLVTCLEFQPTRNQQSLLKCELRGRIIIFISGFVVKGNRFSAVCFAKIVCLLPYCYLWGAARAANFERCMQSKAQHKVFNTSESDRREIRASARRVRAHNALPSRSPRGVYLMEYYDYGEANNNLREQTRCKQTCMKSHPRAHPRDSETCVQSEKREPER